MGVLPQGRGTPSDIHHRIQCVRFILADAGNSWLFGVLKRTKTVYPRWRGELDSMATVTACPGGLSPLARGTPPLRSSTRSISRFIPAGAGNSRSILLALFRLAVYPRWRGELCIKTSVKNFAVGLSPLARGTRTRDAPRFVGTRFIPAGAGNSHHDARATRQGSVYPRWRGELFPRDCDRHRPIGLSPLARGTHVMNIKLFTLSRFIPAGAGNSVAAAHR